MLLYSVQVPCIYLAGRSVRAGVLISGFLMAGGAGLRYLSKQYLALCLRLLPLSEYWFTLACNACGVTAGGLAGAGY